MGLNLRIATCLLFTVTSACVPGQQEARPTDAGSNPLQNPQGGYGYGGVGSKLDPSLVQKVQSIIAGKSDFAISEDGLWIVCERLNSRLEADGEIIYLGILDGETSTQLVNYRPTQDWDLVLADHPGVGSAIQFAWRMGGANREEDMCLPLDRPYATERERWDRPKVCEWQKQGRLDSRSIAVPDDSFYTKWTLRLTLDPIEVAPDRDGTVFGTGITSRQLPGSGRYGIAEKLSCFRGVSVDRAASGGGVYQSQLKKRFPWVVPAN